MSRPRTLEEVGLPERHATAFRIYDRLGYGVSESACRVIATMLDEAGRAPPLAWKKEMKRAHRLCRRLADLYGAQPEARVPTVREGGK